MMRVVDGAGGPGWSESEVRVACWSADGVDVVIGWVGRAAFARRAGCGGSSDAGSRAREASPARIIRVGPIAGEPAADELSGIMPAATAIPKVGPTFVAVCLSPR